MFFFVFPLSISYRGVVFLRIDIMSGLLRSVRPLPCMCCTRLVFLSFLSEYQPSVLSHMYGRGNLSDHRAPIVLIDLDASLGLVGAPPPSYQSLWLCPVGGAKIGFPGPLLQHTRAVSHGFVSFEHQTRVCSPVNGPGGICVDF